MKHVCVVSLSETARDPRVSKQIRWLASEFRVTTVGLGNGALLQNVKHLRIPEPKWGKSEKIVAGLALVTGFHERALRALPGGAELEAITKEVSADLWIANDIETLPICLDAADRTGAGVWFDAHEFYPAEFDSSLRWRLLFRRFKSALCRRYIPKASGFSTVSNGVAEAYRQFLGRTPIVLTNAPPYADIPVRSVDPTAPIRLVHHGAALRNRRLEHIIGVLDHLDPTVYTLDLFLVASDAAYLDELKEYGKKFRNLRFNPPVAMLELSKRLSEFDVGIYSLPPDNLNDEFALPNKFFEFIQARLCLALGPSLEMKAITEKYGLGVIARDFSGKSLAEAILGLSRDQIFKHKLASDRAAHELSAEPNRERFLEDVKALLYGN